MPAFHGVPGLQVLGNVSYRLDIQALGGYVGYFVAGYYFSHYELKPRTAADPPRLGPVGGGLHHGPHCPQLFGAAGAQPKMVPVFHTQCGADVPFAIFLFFKNKVTGKHLGRRGLRLRRRVAEYSFGIYRAQCQLLQQPAGLPGAGCRDLHPAGRPCRWLQSWCFWPAIWPIWLLAKIPWFRKYCM